MVAMSGSVGCERQCIWRIGLLRNARKAYAPCPCQHRWNGWGFTHHRWLALSLIFGEQGGRQVSTYMAGAERSRLPHMMEWCRVVLVHMSCCVAFCSALSAVASVALCVYALLMRRGLTVCAGAPPPLNVGGLEPVPPVLAGRRLQHSRAAVELLLVQYGINHGPCRVRASPSRASRSPSRARGHGAWAWRVSRGSVCVSLWL